MRGDKTKKEKKEEKEKKTLPFPSIPFFLAVLFLDARAVVVCFMCDGGWDRMRDLFIYSREKNNYDALAMRLYSIIHDKHDIRSNFCLVSTSGGQADRLLWQ